MTNIGPKNAHGQAGLHGSIIGHPLHRYTLSPTKPPHIRKHTAVHRQPNHPATCLGTPVALPPEAPVKYGQGSPHLPAEQRRTWLNRKRIYQE